MFRPHHEFAPKGCAVGANRVVGATVRTLTAALALTAALGMPAIVSSAVADVMPAPGLPGPELSNPPDALPAARVKQAPSSLRSMAVLQAAGNGVYEVFVADGASGACGAWTARTGNLHEAGAGHNVIYGGESGSPGTSDTILRSYTTGLSYRTGSGRSACDAICDVAEPDIVELTSGPFVMGFRMTWRFQDGGGGGRVVELEQTVVVEGPIDGSQSVDNTVIRETHVVRNFGPGTFRYGLRKHWDWQIANDDGPFFATCEHPDEGCDRSMSFGDGGTAGPYPNNYVMNPDPGPARCPDGITPRDRSGCDGTPRYIVAGTIAPPASLSPPPDPPDLLQFNAWPNLVNSCWAPPIEDFALCGALQSSGRDDTSIAYYYGLDSGSAHVLAPGGERSYTQYVVAAESDCPDVLEPRDLSCNANGPYSAPCAGARTSIPLDATVTSDGGTPVLSWASTCPGAAFDDPSIEDPIFSFDTSSCGRSCTVTLTLTSGSETSTCDAIVSVIDDAPPVLSCPGNLTVACTSGGVRADDPVVAAWLASATASDACNTAALTHDMPSVVSMTSCPTVTVVTFTATDACGNESSCQRRLTLQDMATPVLSCPRDTSSECGATAAGDRQAWLDSASANDACSGAVAVVPTLVGAEPACGGVAETWMFTATDACGNRVTCEARWVEGDTEPPALVTPANGGAECGPDAESARQAWLASASASDTCAGSIAPQHEVVSETAPCTGSAVQRVRFTAADACGHEAEGFATWTISDSTAPDLLGVPPDATVECDDIPPPATVTAQDICDPAPTIVFRESESLRLRTQAATESERIRRYPDGRQVGSVRDASALAASSSHCEDERVIERTWTATDACGNSSERKQLLTVVDSRAPVLSGVPADMTASCDAIPSAANLTALDTCDPAPLVTVVETREDGACPDTHALVRTWTATDRCGNFTVARQRIEVSDDLAPVLRGVPGDATLSCDDATTAATPTADDADRDPAPLVTMAEVREDGACPDTYALVRTWTATDRCGNFTVARQRIEVSDDLAPALRGVPADASVECDAIPIAAAPTSDDACDPAPVVDFTETRVDGRCPAAHVLNREWTALDRCGNLARARQIVTVDDTNPPVLTPPSDTVVECPAPLSGPLSEAGWIDSGLAEDGCSAARVESTEIERVPGCGQSVRIVREFWAVDACANASARVRRSYEVRDVTPPHLLAPASLTVECPAPMAGPLSEAAWLASARATDSCGEARVDTRLIEVRPGCGSTYVHVHELVAIDACGNASERVLREYAVVDSTPPAFSQAGPQFRFSLWPPQHGYVVYATSDVVQATDTCSVVTVRATGCRSSQPEDVHMGPANDGGNGDGHTVEDCVLSADGTQFAVRAERLGACGADSARTYEVIFTATDECGQSSTASGLLVVEHDRSGHQDRRPSHWLGPNDPPPFPYVHVTEYGPGC